MHRSETGPHTDSLAQIATAEALALWLDDRGLGHLAPGLIGHGLLGDALLDAERDQPRGIVGDAADRLGRLSGDMQRLRTAVAPAFTQAELDAGTDRCRALGRDWRAQPWLADLVATWPGRFAHEVAMLEPLVPWAHLTLEVATADGPTPLIGAEGQQAHHAAAGGGAHTEDPVPLLLVRRGGVGGGLAVGGFYGGFDGDSDPDSDPDPDSDTGPKHAAALTLGSYLSARVCAICGYRDVFIYNGWDRGRGRFDLLDYQIGHRMREP